MKTILAASMIVMMAGASFAQTTTGDAGASGNVGELSASGGVDAANYLESPNIAQFYTDDTMATMKSEAEVKATMDAMSEEDRASLATACEANQDTKHEQLCLSLRTN